MRYNGDSLPFDGLSPIDYLRGIRDGNIVPTLEHLQEALRAVLDNQDSALSSTQEDTVMPLDHNHHTLWNALCEACGLIHHSAMGNENEKTHEISCMDFMERFRTHPDIKRIQRDVIKSNDHLVSFSSTTCAPSEIVEGSQS